MLLVHVHSAFFMTAISFGVRIIVKIVTKMRMKFPVFKMQIIH